MEVSQLKVEVETLYQSCLEFEEYKKRLDSNARLVYVTCAHVRVYVCVCVCVLMCNISTFWSQFYVPLASYV